MIKACVIGWVGILLFLGLMFVLPNPYRYYLWIPYGILLPLAIVKGNRKQKKIEAVAAYNTNKKFHPKEKNWLGFIVTLGGCRIYHAGDTDLIEEMADLNVDIALLPVSGTYVMTAEEAVEAAKRIKPKIAIPMHYDSLAGSEVDARAFAKGLEGICEVKLIRRS